MAILDKGVVSAIKDGGSKAEVIPATSNDSVTLPLVVPALLRDNLKVNTEVAYVVFDDNTGVIVCRMDGIDTHRHQYTSGDETGTTSGPI